MLYFLWQWARPDHDIFVTGFTWHVDIEKETVNNVSLFSDDFPQGYNHSYLREAKWCASNLIENANFRFGDLAERALFYVRWATVDQDFEKRFHEGKNGDWRYDEQRWMVGKEQLRQFIDLLPDSDRVLDLGSGPRSMVEYFDVEPRERWVCIDPLMHSYKEMGKATFPDHVDARYGQAEDLVEELKGAFTVVWCHNVLDHCHDPQKVLRNIHHYLCRGGVAYIGTDVHPPKRGHLGVGIDIAAELNALGLRVKHFHRKKDKSEGTFVRDQTYIVEKP